MNYGKRLEAQHEGIEEREATRYTLVDLHGRGWEDIEKDAAKVQAEIDKRIRWLKHEATVGEARANIEVAYERHSLPSDELKPVVNYPAETDLPTLTEASVAYEAPAGISTSLDDGSSGRPPLVSPLTLLRAMWTVSTFDSRTQAKHPNDLINYHYSEARKHHFRLHIRPAYASNTASIVMS